MRQYGKAGVAWPLETPAFGPGMQYVRNKGESATMMRLPSKQTHQLNHDQWNISSKCAVNLEPRPPFTGADVDASATDEDVESEASPANGSCRERPRKSRIQLRIKDETQYA